MIVVSLVLILLSGVALAAGIIRGEDLFVIGSIMVSLAAAATLFAGIRQQRRALARRLASPRLLEESTAVVPAARTVGSGRTRAAGELKESPDRFDTMALAISGPDPAVGGQRVDEAAWAGGVESADAPIEDDAPLEDPPDEPPAELLMASEVSRLAQLDLDVFVVDGRPRYHLADCAHLADKSAQSLPAAEAVELGFTACGMCAAASSLLEQTARS